MHTTRRTFLKTAAAPALLAQKPHQPDVLFVLVDEWRAHATGYNGDPNVHTPTLDAFASGSVNLENAISGTPVCCPYRGSLLTGQYPLTNGVFINDVELKPKGVTLGEAYKRSGYRTGYIGKWHVYGSPGGQNERRQDYIPSEKRFGFDYWKACECTHNYNHSLYYEGNDQTQKYWPGYDAIAQTEDACGFIERQSKSRDPYFLLLSLGPPHFPYDTAPATYKNMYQDREIRLRPNVPEDQRQKSTEILRGYYAHIAALDDCLKRLLASLERTGKAENTIVVFTSDHGDMMLSQGLTTKLYPWDESLHVPFLIRYPGKFGKKGRRVSTPVNAPDIMPTLLGMCGLHAPDSVEGQDAFAPRSKAGAFINLPVPITEARRHGFAEYRGLRTEHHTYVRSIRGPWLLYDHDRDPYQMHNLCGKAEHKQVQSELDHALDTRLRELKDDFLPGPEYLRRAGLTHYKEANVPIGYHRSPWGDWESTVKP